MSDLCLVASMVAKMHLAAEQNSAPVPPADTSVNRANPKAVKPEAVEMKPSLVKEPPPLEFSANCAKTVERVYAQPERILPIAVRPNGSVSRPSSDRPEFTPVRNAGSGTSLAPRFNTSYQGPTSGPQLYQQRLTALQRGTLYTRLPSNSFQDSWRNATSQPSYEQWKNILDQEARAVGLGQGNNKLSVTLGDSLSLWMPTEALPSGQLWLNQGISGDTTTGILRRLGSLRQTRPDHIYVMAGINDLRQGATDYQVLTNLRQIMQELRSDHPQANILIQSILPTAIGIPNDRIRRLNEQLAVMAQQEGVKYLDLYSHFADARGEMRPELTTDGLHLSAMGYGIWQSVLREVEYLLATEPQFSFAA
ncbi:MAG: SGNH/GDSL hydrolase family protein [Prochlorotrichaceae cyanobacterium]|jgi:lysophospholipase L1-like esterase